MKMYDSNLFYFKENAPLLYQVLTRETPKFEVSLEKDAFYDQYRMKLGNKSILLNSAFDKEQEYFELFQSIDPDVEVIILVGIGDGSIFEYIKKENKKIRHLVVVEPYLNNFRLFLSNNDIKAVFKDLGNISLVVNKTPEEASEMVFELTRGINYKTNVVSQVSYFQINPKYIYEFSEEIKIGFRSKLSSIATINAMRYRWLVNTIYNFKQVDVQSDILYDYLKGKPAIIVSAGPSLNKHIEKLKAIQDKAVIVAAGSAIKILSSHGIKPHLRIAIDADGDSDLYDSKFYEEAPEVPLLYANQLNFEILPSYKGEKLLMSIPTDLMGNYFKSSIEYPIKRVASGSSVVHSALSLLSEAQCEPIIFVGQDMCFYDNNLYAKGREIGSMNNYHNRTLIKQQDIYGNEVYALRNYLQIKYDYEGMIKVYKNKILNATEGGLGIKGVPNVTFDEVVETYLKHNLDETPLEYIKKNRDKYCIEKDVVENFIIRIYEETEELLSYVEDRRAEIVLLEEDLKASKNIQYLKNRLTQLDVEYEAKLSENEYYNRVVRNNIGAQVLALKSMMNRDTDKNSIEYVKMGIKYLHSIMTEVEIFLELTKDFIVEVFPYLPINKNVSVSGNAE